MSEFLNEVGPWILIVAAAIVLAVLSIAFRRMLRKKKFGAESQQFLPGYAVSWDREILAGLAIVLFIGPIAYTCSLILFLKEKMPNVYPLAIEYPLLFLLGGYLFWIVCSLARRVRSLSKRGLLPKITRATRDRATGDDIL